MLPTENDKRKNNSLLQYASMGTQLLAGIGIAVFLGLKADRWIGIKFPVLVWVLPLLVIAGFFYKLIKSTDKKND